MILTYARIVTAAIALAMGLGVVCAPSMALAQQVVAKGAFKGAGGHQSSGGISLVRNGKTLRVVFAGNFKLDGAPDPKIAFGNNGYVQGTIFARLRSLNGAQTYTVPAGTKLAQYNEIWLWCERFNVPLAVARLNRTGG